MTKLLATAALIAATVFSPAQAQSNLDFGNGKTIGLLFQMEALCGDFVEPVNVRHRQVLALGLARVRESSRATSVRYQDFSDGYLTGVTDVVAVVNLAETTFASRGLFEGDPISVRYEQACLNAVALRWPYDFQLIGWRTSE